jgi:O-antigen/teichoic acid export membrane protein
MSQPGSDALADATIPQSEAVTALWHRSLRQIFVSDIGRLVGAGAIAQALTFAASPLLTRIYTPADFGVLAQYVALSSVLQVVAACRYDLTIPLAEADDEAARLLVLSCALTLCTSLFVAILLLTGIPSAVAHTQWAAARAVFWVLPLSMIAGGLYQSLSYFAARRKAFPELAHTKVIQTIGSTSTQLSLGVLQVGALGLVLGQLANSGLGIARLVRRLDVRSAVRPLRLSVRELTELAVQRLHFATAYSVSAIVNQLGLGIHLLLVGGIYGLSAAGQLMLTSRLLAVIDLIVGPIAQVYYADACVAYRASPTQLRQLFLRTSSRLLALGILFALCTWFLGPLAVTVIFGGAWHDAGVFLRYLSILAFANTVASPLSMTLAVLGRPRLQLLWDLARLAAIVGAFTFAKQAGLTAQAAVLLFACVAGSALVLLYLVNLTLVLRQGEVA